MPATSIAQQRFFGVELARKREGKPTRTDMSEKQLKDFASTSLKGLPKKVKPKHPRKDGEPYADWLKRNAEENRKGR